MGIAAIEDWDREIVGKVDYVAIRTIAVWLRGVIQRSSGPYQTKSIMWTLQKIYDKAAELGADCREMIVNTFVNEEWQIGFGKVYARSGTNMLDDGLTRNSTNLTDAGLTVRSGIFLKDPVLISGGGTYEAEVVLPQFMDIFFDLGPEDKDAQFSKTVGPWYCERGGFTITIEPVNLTRSPRFRFWMAIAALSQTLQWMWETKKPRLIFEDFEAFIWDGQYTIASIKLLRGRPRSSAIEIDSSKRS